jgi:hypothetical protein
VRLKQFVPELQRELEPMAEDIARARVEQMAAYQKNGPHTQVVWLEKASHSLFVDRAREVAASMLKLLDQTNQQVRDDAALPWGTPWCGGTRASRNMFHQRHVRGNV